MAITYPVHAIESKWRDAWQTSKCFRAPEQPLGEKFFNFDSGPFPNGALHMGHVRTYVLGDVTARFQRLLGKSVLYCTEWDSFGLPNELGASEAGVPPAEFTAANIARMREGLERLGISYDWSRIKSTCDPEYIRATQDLFLELWRHGLIYRSDAQVPWCPLCVTSVAQMQADNGRCWRCGATVQARVMPQWYVAVSRFTDRLLNGIPALVRWSDTGKRLLHRGLADQLLFDTDAPTSRDWHISRQRKWGTPIPVIHCSRCGAIASNGLSDSLPLKNESRHKAQCPRCGGLARREIDTLDCFFDDSWSYLSCIGALDGRSFPDRELISLWMPVDHFHSGFDTFTYLNLYRFMGMFLHDCGVLPCEEPLSRYDGHNMVTFSGRKMSKHLGNVVDVEKLLEKHGADALRIAILWSAAPSKAIDWGDSALDRSLGLIGRIHNTVSATIPAISAAANTSFGGTSRAAAKLGHNLRVGWQRIYRFVDEYRPNAAVEEIHECVQRLDEFVESRLRSTRLKSDDAVLIGDLLREFAIVLSPFAPFLAEEIGSKMGLRAFAATSKWPESHPSASK